MSLGVLNRMSKQSHSQDFHFEFETRWGGVPTEIQQFEWWAAKQKPPIKFICEHFLIPWYAKWWLDYKMERTMRQVDQQVKAMHEYWDAEERETGPKIISKPSEVDGLDELYLSYDSDPKTNYPDPSEWYQGPLEVFEGAEEGAATGQNLPDPWEEK